ncbi:ABC-2 type transporter [Salinarchaeum sp. Harcht-Bsk1]|uniref:ABC transporter permease n=1 Tax=Salinarchaeum sp. Harcht-Bsk1 TaxID=1333523 RepID=UPI000342407A|nr:ABC transporter permease [Salinarchaeum sp. Harcht-Bsk1]AGN01051.1 ABC-2 type transporter [Salinarchaeum sp. Harcht-Bsk1]
MSRDPRLTIARRELAALKSEKTIVLALLIQLFVAGFSSFLVVGLVSMYDPSSVEGGSVGVAIVGEGDEDVADSLESVDGVEPTSFADVTEAHTRFRDGRFDALLVVTESEDGRLRIRASVPDSGVRSTLVVVRLREGLQQVERDRRASFSDRLDFEPIALPESSAGSPYVGFTYTVLVPLLCFLPVFISGSIAVDSISEELERGTFELLRAAPVSLVDILDGKLLAAGSLAPLQAALWLALLRFNGIPIEHALPVVGLVAALTAAIVGLGIAIALLAPDRRQAQLVYSVGVLSVFVVASLLPEHPANTVAKLAIGNPTDATWTLLAGYLVAGASALVVVRGLVGRLSVEHLGGDR